MSRFATRRRPTTVVAQTSVRKKIDARDAARSFAKAARGFTPRQLADAADSTLEAAKFWLEAKRAPNSANLLNMARTLPWVMDWFIAESAAGNPAARSNSNDGVLRALHELARFDGAEGDTARAILAKFYAGRLT